MGRRMKQYRLTLGLTQRELSEKANVSVPTIQKFEAGTATNITLSNLLSLMRHTGLIERADGIVPLEPESPYTKRKISKVRHGKQER